MIVLFVPLSAHAQYNIPSNNGSGIKGGLGNLRQSVPDYNNNNIVGQNEDVVSLIGRIIRYALYLVGAIAVLFVLYGGFLYLTAGGAEDQAKKGRQTIEYALIGIAIVILSYVIVNVVVNFITAS